MKYGVYMPTTIGDQILDDVDHFVYLGSVISKTGGSDEDIEAKISKARQKSKIQYGKIQISRGKPNYGSSTLMSRLSCSKRCKSLPIPV